MTYSQLDNRWKDMIMGDINPPNPSTNPIGEYGCLLCSLVSGLSDRGYGWDPASFNLLLRAKGAWTGPFKDYIDVANLSSYMPDVFVSFQKVDPWNTLPKIDNLIGANLIVVCRVNAAAIGGTGTHYLYLVGQQNGIALIYDPWRNVTELITKTYGKYTDPKTGKQGNWGYILGINIFTVRVKSTPPPTPPIIQTPAPVTTPTPVVVPPVVPAQVDVSAPDETVTITTTQPVEVPAVEVPEPPTPQPILVPEPVPTNPIDNQSTLFAMLVGFLAVLVQKLKGLLAPKK
jgi:hypothetical protein